MQLTKSKSLGIYDLQSLHKQIDQAGAPV